MNLLDFFFVALLLFSLYQGWQKGFINGFLELLMLAAGLLGAFALYPAVHHFLQTYMPRLGIWLLPLSFLVPLILLRIALSMLLNVVLRSIPDAAYTSTANSILGLFPGAVNGVVWCIVIAALLLSVPFSDSLAHQTDGSLLTGKMADQVAWLDEKFSSVFEDAVNKTMRTLKHKSEDGTEEEEKFVELPFKVADPEVRTDLEQRMLELVNQERIKAGLKPLKFDPALLPVARAHSKDMFARGYFSHINPEGLSPFDRMHNAKVYFLAAGENLALGQTLTICHHGLMNSPGHRANILNKAFGRVAIAILDGGIYGLMITQNFRN